MKKTFLPFLILFCCFGYSQEISLDAEKLLAEMSDDICKCIDSIPYNTLKDAIDFRINKCIDEKATAYQMGKKLASIDLSAPTSNINITIDENSDEYKKYYYEMESYLMINCQPLRVRMASDNTTRQNSL